MVIAPPPQLQKTGGIYWLDVELHFTLMLWPLAAEIACLLDFGETTRPRRAYFFESAIELEFLSWLGTAAILRIIFLFEKRI